MLPLGVENTEGLTVEEFGGKREASNIGKLDGRDVGIFTGTCVGLILVGGDVRLAKIPGGNRCEREISTG